jgi:ATP-dependent RNA helicase SUPV3L1/SUV3
LETEIGKTGEVIVEGHTIGRLDGFTFAPDAAEAGSEAKALQAAAQKALAGEIDARATKLAAAPDDQFLLTSDGTVRWMGDAVGKLMAADNVLQPRLRLIADDRLSGAPREAVQTRLDLWLKTHIEKILGPMFELSNAADITGIGRGIAFQLVEAAGVLDRQKISAEMKDLDQPSRASLRKYGVRFGAYHIYLPNLLKPAARALASLLWSLKHDNLDLAALTTAQHLAGAGRTSFPVDKALDRDAYRVLGYKLAGERAVRVDILERLADLIRPALSWRPGSSLPKPPGAFDGRAFTVTQSMTSLTGSAGEDFASVLRSLGYRSEKRPPLPPEQVAAAEAPVETAVSQEISSEAAPEADALVSGASSGEATPSQPTVLEANETDAGPALATIEEAPVLAAATDATIAEPVAEVGSPTNDASADIAAVAPVEQSSSEQAPVEPTAPVEAAESSAGDAAPAEPAAAADAPPIAPELVEVWRPGGRSDERQHQRPRHRRPEHARAQVSGEGATAETGERPPRDQQHRRDRKDFRGRRPEPRTDAPVPGAASGDATVGTPPSSQANARPGQERPRFQGKGGKPENRSSSGKPYQGNKPHQGRGDRNRGAPPREEYQRPAPKERPIDPNSPFAKLAALKEQLEKR